MLKYSQSFYQGKINELEGYASILITHIDNLKNYKSQLPEFWDDDNGLTTARALETAIVNTKASLTQIKLQLAQYNNIVEQYGADDATMIQLCLNCKHKSFRGYSANSRKRYCYP